jgi:SAM-dependent methyltransferase
MTGYYDDRLSAQRLKRVYEIAPPRVRQYLNAEIEYVLSRIHSGDRVLDLGCGYGRIMPRLAAKAAMVAGIDNAKASLLMARDELRGIENCHLACMNAIHLGFPDAVFDRVICIQNGISAFHVDRRALMSESLRVTRLGGTALFSTYSAKFWNERLAWFELQAAEGLLGEIDYERTRDGVIVCKDGFTATTIDPAEFSMLVSGFMVSSQVMEVDGSSVFCELTLP